LPRAPASVDLAFVPGGVVAAEASSIGARDMMEQSDPTPAPEHRVGAATPDDTRPAESAAAGAPPPTIDQVKLVLRRVKDPELNLNILDLGLVYDIRVAGGIVEVDMTLTSPGCPSGPEIMGDAERQLRTMPGVSEVVMNLVWSPFWTPDKIEPRVRAYLGF